MLWPVAKRTPATRLAAAAPARPCLDATVAPTTGLVALEHTMLRKVCKLMLACMVRRVKNEEAHKGLVLVRTSTLGSVRELYTVEF